MAATYDVELPQSCCSQPALDSLDNYRKGTQIADGCALVYWPCDLPHHTHTHMVNTYNTDTLRQRFSNFGPRTTSGPRVLTLWSF